MAAMFRRKRQRFPAGQAGLSSQLEGTVRLPVNGLCDSWEREGVEDEIQKAWAGRTRLSPRERAALAPEREDCRGAGEHTAPRDACTAACWPGGSGPRSLPRPSSASLGDGFQQRLLVVVLKHRY